MELLKAPKALSDVRVLVVDDSADLREMIEFFLTKAGATVEVAENGNQAVEMALSNEFDVVLMDIQMPGLDGNQAVKILVEHNYDRPVIAVTAAARKEERDYSLKVGFCDYISKPVDRNLLIAKVMAWVQLGRPDSLATQSLVNL